MFLVHVFTKQDPNTRFEVFLAVKNKVEVFWVVTPCSRIPTFRVTLLPPSWQWSDRWWKRKEYSLYSEDGGSMVLRNYGILLQHYTASQPRRLRQQGLPKRRYPTTTLHGVTTQKTSTWIKSIRHIWNTLLCSELNYLSMMQFHYTTYSWVSGTGGFDFSRSFLRL